MSWCIVAFIVTVWQPVVYSTTVTVSPLPPLILPLPSTVGPDNTTHRVGLVYWKFYLFTPGNQLWIRLNHVKYRVKHWFNTRINYCPASVCTRDGCYFLVHNFLPCHVATIAFRMQSISCQKQLKCCHIHVGKFRASGPLRLLHNTMAIVKVCHTVHNHKVTLPPYLPQSRLS